MVSEEEEKGRKKEKRGRLAGPQRKGGAARNSPSPEPITSVPFMREGKKERRDGSPKSDPFASCRHQRKSVSKKEKGEKRENWRLRRRRTSIWNDVAMKQVQWLCINGGKKNSNAVAFLEEKRLGNRQTRSATTGLVELKAELHRNKPAPARAKVGGRKEKTS